MSEKLINLGLHYCPNLEIYIIARPGDKIEDGTDPDAYVTNEILEDDKTDYEAIIKGELPPQQILGLWFEDQKQAVSAIYHFIQFLELKEAKKNMSSDDNRVSSFDTKKTVIEHL